MWSLFRQESQSAALLQLSETLGTRTRQDCNLWGSNAAKKPETLSRKESGRHQSSAQKVENHKEESMSIYKRGNVYWYDFVFNGERHQGSTKQGNQRVAQQIEAAERTRLAKGEAGIKDRKPIPTFSEFGKRFLAKMLTDHAAKPKTAAHYSNG